MPQFKTGDMWTAYTAVDLFLITTNSTLRQGDHALVMGRGIARQAKERFPGLDTALGRQIQALCGNQGIYGLLISLRWPAAKLGAFQVKRHYSQPASTSAGSAQALASSGTARPRCVPGVLIIPMPKSP